MHTYSATSNADRTLLIAFRSYFLYRDRFKVQDTFASLVGEKLAADITPYFMRAFGAYFTYRTCKGKKSERTSSPSINEEEKTMIGIFTASARGSRSEAKKLSSTVLSEVGCNAFLTEIDPVVDALRVSASIQPPISQSGDAPFLYGASKGFDLTNTEALILYSIRAWVFSMSNGQSPENNLVKLFESHNIKERPALEFNHFMHIVNTNLIRPMIVQCQCTTTISVDEVRLLGTLAACQFNIDFQVYHHVLSFTNQSAVKTIRQNANNFLSFLNKTERWLPMRKWDLTEINKTNFGEQQTTIMQTHPAPQTTQ